MSEWKSLNEHARKDICSNINIWLEISELKNVRIEIFEGRCPNVNVRIEIFVRNIRM